MTDPKAQDAALEALYARVPDIPGCKGLCHNSCTSIEMSERERTRLREEEGMEFTPDAIAKRKLPETGVAHRCEALGPDNRCTVYEKRPMVCRVFGTTRTRVGEGLGFLNCEYDCIPERTLSEGEALDLIGESFRVGGLPSAWVERRQHGA